MIRRLARIRREFLGLNRRNHAYLFAHNPRERYHLVDDKRTTKALLAAHDVPTPATLATCERPWQIETLRERLLAAAAFALKPARGAGGAGIVVVTARDGARFVRASGLPIGWPELAIHAADILAGTYSSSGFEDAVLVEALLVAHPALARLAYRGVPDLRVLVFRGVPILAMLRLPTCRSDGRANLHLGGIGVGVDLATGTTGPGIQQGRTVERHPDLDVALAGNVVPAWDAALTLAVRAADAVGLGFLGVDLVVDAARGPLVLELNARPGLAIQLANRDGLRPRLDAVARATVGGVEARVAFGCALAATSRTGS